VEHPPALLDELLRRSQTSVSAPPQRSAQTLAFEQFYAETAPDIRRYVRRRIDHSLADDVVGETFTVVWRRWRDAPTADADRRAWTFGVARNLVRSMQRKDAMSRLLPWHARTIADPAQLVAESDGLEGLLRALSPVEREAVELTVLAGLDPSQAARVVGCSPTAMTSRLHRARRHLESVLAAESSQAAGRPAEEVHHGS
jgi:RNA polymerase sigma-70 factor (ECF subfamily)